MPPSLVWIISRDYRPEAAHLVSGAFRQQRTQLATHPISNAFLMLQTPLLTHSPCNVTTQKCPTRRCHYCLNSCSMMIYNLVKSGSRILS
ncbi:hypothetical protein BaRGS_00033130 [Batillaria attramentaria]|uniref:Uncharacterized protein n=1 Tax=Batillaria attramentaria TaxID=370345 RepID=A0ABD0JMD2_9CAEN